MSDDQRIVFELTLPKGADLHAIWVTISEVLEIRPDVAALYLYPEELWESVRRQEQERIAQAIEARRDQLDRLTRDVPWQLAYSEAAHIARDGGDQ